MREHVKTILDWFDQEFHRCDEYSFDCLQCRSMRLRDDIESYFYFIFFLEDEGIDGKKVRPHKDMVKIYDDLSEEEKKVIDELWDMTWKKYLEQRPSFKSEVPVNKIPAMQKTPGVINEMPEV